MKTARVPWKLLSEDDRETIGLGPWKIVWSKPSTPLPSSKLLIQIVMGERTFVVFQTLYFGSFCYTSYPKHYGKHSFTLSPPSRHIFSECRNIIAWSTMVNGEPDRHLSLPSWLLYSGYCSNSSLLHCLHYLSFYQNTNVKHYLAKHKIQGQPILSLLNSMQRKWILLVCMHMVRLLKEYSFFLNER